MPLGEESAVYEFGAPNDKTSLLYGTGIDKCGNRLISLSDKEGNPNNMTNFEFISYQNKFEFTLSSYASAGIVHEQEMMLTVTLEEYPDVPATTIPFTVQYREY